jgi:hypothetical protein
VTFGSQWRSLLAGTVTWFRAKLFTSFFVSAVGAIQRAAFAQVLFNAIVIELKCSIDGWESLMSRALFVGTLLFVGPCLSMSWAQNKTEPPQPGPPFPNGSNITFQWDYSCPSGKDCSFICPGGGASHATKLTIYLGTIPVGSTQDPAVFYDFSTREISRANGFTISAGLGTLSCQVNGMSLDYSGPPK